MTAVFVVIVNVVTLDHREPPARRNLSVAQREVLNIDPAIKLKQKRNISLFGDPTENPSFERHNDITISDDL